MVDSISSNFAAILIQKSFEFEVRLCQSIYNSLFFVLGNIQQIRKQAEAEVLPRSS